MRRRRILSRRIEETLHGLVHRKLHGRERDAHRQCGRVRDVERLESFCPVDRLGAVEDCFMYRSAYLHALLDHYRGNQHELIYLPATNDSPSNGFMNASEAIVAAAPATAVPAAPCTPTFAPPVISLTNSYVPK